MPGPDFRGPGGNWAGGPSQHQKSYASSLHERDALISAYEHLTSLPRPADALLRLRKIASLVKPIMRKRGWHVGTLAEFLPSNQQLLGLNINHGQKICVRLRYTHDPSTFLPVEQCVDTMLHELSHIVHGPHDAKFHALWDELRSEHETLLFRGYTGEGFLTPGHRLGGGGNMPPTHEIRRLARQNAENDRLSRNASNQRRGVRLGGSRILPGQDPRKVIADAVERRNAIDKGCASGSAEADRLSTQTATQSTRTQSSEDDANDRAIAEALLELMEEEELQKINAAGGAPEPGLAWDPQRGLYSSGDYAGGSTSATKGMTEEEQMEWAMRESMRAVASYSQGTPAAKPPTPDYASKPNLGAGTSRPPSSPEKTAPPAKRPRGIEASAHDPIPKTQPPPAPQPASTPNTAPEWACDVCTCLNPPTYLACLACNMERPSAPPPNKLRGSSAAANLAHVERQAAALQAPKTMGWACRRCGTFVEHQYWTCTACGLMKGDSRASEHVR